MPPLSPELRSKLETAIINARDASEQAAHAALLALAVDRDRPFPTLPEDKRRLRNALRARARFLRDEFHLDGFQPLVEEVAYEQWHRMLFARFLYENNLLMHPSGVPVTLQDCADLAPAEGEADAWSVAATYAGLMLPGIFRQEDPSHQVRFAPEGRNKLERIMMDLPSIFFTSDDTLGWVYQFWQSKLKDEVNNSKRKIGGTDIYPVTQLFTENYMVKFLLENSIGAWWAARHPKSPLIKEWEYLRINNDGIPIAGMFPNWPERAAELTVMDPCCGSGHFLVMALEMLTKIRMEEEALNAAQAGDAALRDNIFGLELDARCTQIAGFALALASWKSGKYRELPILHIGTSGTPVKGQLEEWLKLVNQDTNTAFSLERIHNLFTYAPDLGSLIDPTNVPVSERIFSPDFSIVEPVLYKALAMESGTSDPASVVFRGVVRGVFLTLKILSSKYTLIATNVPFLGRGKQCEVLKNFCVTYFPDSKFDLATVFLERCLSMAKEGGTCATVTPQAWLFASSYRKFREKLLQTSRFHLLSILGEGGFVSKKAAGAFTILSIISHENPTANSTFTGADLSNIDGAINKSKVIRTAEMQVFNQLTQIRNPEKRIVLAHKTHDTLLSTYARSLQGIKTGDDNKLRRFFWEIDKISRRWKLYQSTVDKTQPYGGLEFIIDWKNNGKDLARLQGSFGWNKKGVAVSLMRELRCSLYTGDIFDSNIAVIIPNNPKHLTAIWQFCQSPEFNRLVRAIDRRVNAMTGSLVKIPFDLSYWEKVARQYQEISVPFSNDPTQWIFIGNIIDSIDPLQVAVAFLLGYEWPHQSQTRLRDYVDLDSILCIPSVSGKKPASERLRSLLASVYNNKWSNLKQEELLAKVGYAGKDLTDWLRDGFFEQHCSLFHNRPFLWQIWDGRKDGFSAIINYHMLDHTLLGRLIYTYLGDWINIQRLDAESGVPGADGRLVAALELKQKLELIREGEPPYDLYIRWKPLHEQPLGWNPDLNDGVRLNIRPFVSASILRNKFTIYWNKDRGKNPDGTECINDLHFTNEQKRTARIAAGLARLKNSDES